MKGVVLSFAIFFCLACKHTGPEAPSQVGAPKPVDKVPQGESVQREDEVPKAPQVQRVPSKCPEGKEVSSGDLSEVGGALYRAYEAALRGNTPEAFEAFQAVFHPDVNRNHLRTQIFPRVVQHVSKYVKSNTDPSFTLCRIEKQTEDRVKVFVLSKDERKSDPPSILVRHEGKWLIDVMTP